MYSWERKGMITTVLELYNEQEELKKKHFVSCGKRREPIFCLLKNWLLYPLIRCIHSNFQFKILRTNSSRAANLVFNEGHLYSRTFQRQIHFQGVFKENPKFKEFSGTVRTLEFRIGLWNIQYSMKQTRVT